MMVDSLNNRNTDGSVFSVTKGIIESEYTMKDMMMVSVMESTLGI